MALTATVASLPCSAHFLPSCSPQNLSNFLWAFAKLGVKSHMLFVEGAHAGRLGLGRDWHSFLPHGCSCAACCEPSVCHSPSQSSALPLATPAACRPASCSLAAGRHATRVMHTFTPQSIANMIWAFATVEQCPDSGLLHVRGAAGAGYAAWGRGGAGRQDAGAVRLPHNTTHS